MARNKFLKRMAVTALAASMTFGTVPAMAINAFAATVVSPVVSANDTTSTDYKIKTALTNATITLAANAALRSDLDASKVTVSDSGQIDGKATHAYVTGVSSAAIELNDAAVGGDTALKDAYDIKTPQVNVNVSLTTGEGTAAKPAGSGVISDNAGALTAAEKVAIAKTVLTADYDTLTYYDTDDAGSIQTKVNALLTGLTNTNTALSLNNGTSEGDVSLTYTVTRGTVVAPTDKADGKITYTVNWKATPYVKGANGVVVAGTPVTDSTTVTGTIDSTHRNADSDSFEDQVIAAVQAADFTSDDFEAKTPATDPATYQLTTDGLNKLKAALKNVDTISDSKIDALTTDDITVDRYTGAKHGTPGSARLTFTTSRNADITTSQDSSVTVRVAVTHGLSAIQSEVYDSLYQAVTALNKDSSSLQAAAAKASTEDEVKVGLKKAIDEQLARTLGTSTTIASEIASYEVVIPKDGYVPSTDTEKGSVKFYVKVDTGVKDSTDPSKTVKWIIGKTATPGDNGIKADEATAAGNDAAFKITNLAKTSAVSATGITLPETMTYLYGSKGLKLQPKFTPADANKYTIKWTSSNSAFKFFADDKETTTTALTDDQTAKLTYIPVLKTVNAAGAPDKTVKSGSTTITAVLYDKDGNVLSKTSTVVSIGKGFSDVQNPSFYAYKAINALANATQWKQTVGTDTTVTNDDKYNEVSSPVIAGVGDNKFDPSSDVTRGQFVTFLYRLAKNDYSYLSATEKIGQKDPATVGTTTKFTDVNPKDYYAQAVAWATEKGVVAGKSATSFDPSGKITRAEAVTMLYRLYANGAKYSHRWTFNDVNTKAFYADAVAYAANTGITVGKSDTVFAPNDNVTRAEAAVFIARAEVEAGNYGSERVTEEKTDSDAPDHTGSILYGNY